MTEFYFFGCTVPLKTVFRSTNEICKSVKWITPVHVQLSEEIIQMALFGEESAVFLCWRRITAMTEQRRDARIIWACCSNTSFHGEESRDPLGGDRMSRSLMVHSWLLVQQWVCRLVCSADQINGWRRGGGSLGSDSRRLFPGQRALLQPAEAPVSGWVREQPLFFKTDSKCALVLNWGCLAMLGMIYSAVCMYTFQFISIFLYIYGYYIGWSLYMVVIINC